MEPLAKLLVSLVELAETELAMLKNGAVRLALSIGMIVAAVLFGMIGACWLLYAVFLWLAMLTNVPTAYAIVGVVFLAAAGILGLMAFKTKKVAKVVTTEAAPVPPGEEGKPHDPAVSIRLAS